MHILMVEDDTFLRDMYLYVFKDEGYEVDVAVDGQEGIDKAKAGAYDLILLDVMLPKKSGIDVLTALRQPESKAAKTPILLLSNLGQESVIEEAFHIGADGYIIKSDLLPRQVFEKVRDFMAGKLKKEDLRPTS